MMITIFSKLRAKVDEGLGYTTYVFENLEESRWDMKYRMVTRCPNWEHRVVNVGEEGFLTYEDHIAGDSKWFDGKDFNSYRYTNVIFMKFVLEKPMIIQSEVILD
jgi:hypothetical protein